MSEETLKVMQMVRDGKITPEEGDKLIAAMGESTASKKTGKKYSMLRVRVDVEDPKKDDQAKVTINVPLTLAKKAAGLLSLVPKDTKNDLNEKGIDLDSIDLKELIELFEDGEITEELVNVETGESGKGAKVKVYVD